MKYFKRVKKGGIELVSKCLHPLIYNSSILHRTHPTTGKPDFVLMLIFFDTNTKEFSTNKCYELADEWLQELDELINDFVATKLVNPKAQA